MSARINSQIVMEASKALVTGGAGFIGSHLVDRLLEEGWRVTVVDNFDPYYSPRRKRSNVEAHRRHPAYRLVEASVTDPDRIETAADAYDVIIHLAAKAGVRSSLEDPALYQQVNVLGTQHLLEKARRWGVEQFIFGSSSSVYGVNPDVPWKEGTTDLRPISPYASTKLSGEMLGHVYSHTYAIRFVGLRFFTVYGARQRPDLAIHKFARRMLAGRPLPIYGDGSTYRDYTHIRDVVDGIMAAVGFEGAPYTLFNLGNGTPVTLNRLIEGLEGALQVKAKRNRLPMQPGDVPATLASIEKARNELGYQPTVTLEEGLRDFAAWIEQEAAERDIRSVALSETV